MHRQRTVAIVAALSLLLAGCAGLRPIPDTDPSWRLNGRLAVVSGERRGAFGVEWNQFGQDYVIDLYGPLGLGVARVEQSEGLVTLKVPGEPEVSARSADELLYVVTGLEIPVSPMRYWVRGMPAPGRHQRTSTGFRQSGWAVDYERSEDGLPRRIVVSRPEARITLVVRRWETSA